MLYKRKWEVSCVTAGGLFLLLVAIKSQMLVTDEYMGSGIAGYQTVSLISYVLLTLLICAVILWAGSINNKKPAKILAILTLCIMPAVSFFMFEMVAGNFFTILHNKVGLVLLNLMIWHLLYAVVFALTNRVRFTVIFLNTFTYLFAVANAFVVQFREQPIMLMDLKSFKTAASVAGEYEYVLTVNMVLMGLLMLLCNLWILNMEFRFLNWKYRITYGVFTCVCIYCSIQGMFAGNLFEKAGSAGLDFSVSI